MIFKMNILFCGSYMPPEHVQYFKYSSEAGNNFQHNLIKKFKESNQIEILSYIGFPMESKYVYALKESLQKTGIHSVLRKGLLSRISGLFLYYVKFLQLVRKCDVVILYNYYYINFLIVTIARFLHVKTVLIIADHTEAGEYTSKSRCWLAQQAEKDYLKFDALIILSKQLYKKTCHKKKLLFPGAINYSAFNDFQLKQRDMVRVLYSGLLNEVTGIDLLLKAIHDVSSKQVQFVFTGRGSMTIVVEQMSQSDKRILYKGFISRDEYYRLLNDVDIVINPRNMNLRENANNFPSKIMEYLASGRIILSTRFAGYEDFTENIKFADSTVESITKGLGLLIEQKSTIAAGYFKENRLKAQSYDWDIQTKRIEEFMKELMAAK